MMHCDILSVGCIIVAIHECYDRVLWCITPWASYQIRKIAGCACAGDAGNGFTATDFKGNRLLARAVMHVGIVNPQWRGKRSRHSRRMRNPQFYVFGKRLIPESGPCGILRSTTRFHYGLGRVVNNNLFSPFFIFWYLKKQQYDP